MTDPLIDGIRQLPLAAPDPDRATRVRARCHARLSAGRRSIGQRRLNSRRLWEPLVAGLGLVYVWEAILVVLELYGLV